MRTGTWMAATWLCLLAGCGQKFYSPCEAADECEDFAPEDADAECVEKSGGGFCSWKCVDDTECDGDQDDDHDFVCASFESNPAMYCFPSCEDDDGDCPGDYTCRSTGGGDENRKVCFP